MSMRVFKIICIIFFKIHWLLFGVISNKSVLMSDYALKSLPLNTILGHSNRLAALCTDWFGLCSLRTPVSVRTFGVIYDHAFSKLANLQLRFQ